MMLTKDNFEKLDKWQIDTALATWRAMSNSTSISPPSALKLEVADDSLDT